jgi:hypothetical protein
MRHAVEGDTSFSAANCRTDFHVEDETTLARMAPQQCLACEHVPCSPPLFSPVTLPVARNCSTNVFTVFLAGTSLDLYRFLNRRWTVTVEFVCRNHSTVRDYCSVVSGGAILNDVTAASVAKYGKKKMLTYDDYGASHRAVHFLYRVSFNQN